MPLERQDYTLFAGDAVTLTVAVAEDPTGLPLVAAFATAAGAAPVLVRTSALDSVATIGGTAVAIPLAADDTAALGAGTFYLNVDRSDLPRVLGHARVTFLARVPVATLPGGDALPDNLLIYL